MQVVAYLANQFPSPVEPYVWDEIQELRRRGVEVIPCSARRAAGNLDDGLRRIAGETLYLQPLEIRLLIAAVWLCLRRWPVLTNFIGRALVRERESPGRRIRALLHTWLGAYYALLLERHGVQHIHVHHGYFGSWIAMVAASLLDIGFSMTLHGSDLLVHGDYLEIKLDNCKFCVTVSEFNRKYILRGYRAIDPAKVSVCYMGVDPPERVLGIPLTQRRTQRLILLAVGRLHAVKDHAFLVQACARLKNQGVRFLCLIAGDGPERESLERLIRDLGLEEEVRLLGHLSRRQLNAYYAISDLVVLTSRSEGIPLTLMEAMTHGRLVLARDITGIPELVLDGQTGFLYRPGSLADFVTKVKVLRNSHSALGTLRQAARQHVLKHFNRIKNVEAFVDFFLAAATSAEAGKSHENPVLQQT